MILEQIYLDCLAQASYLVGDPESGVAAVVDPRRDVDVYLEAAAARGLRIEHVLLTHFHADFVSGHLELRERTGATIHLGARAEATFEFERRAEDGDPLRLGAVRIETLETPGHTPESACYVVFDESASVDCPQAVFTGDTLFVGDVGRPDLMASVGMTKEELAAALFDSLHDKVMRLPGATKVYPAHGAGSLCGKALGSETSSTIETQRDHNAALKLPTRAAFIAELTADQPPAPAYFPFAAQRNKEAHEVLEAAVERGLKGLDLKAFEAKAAEPGHKVLDLRNEASFAEGHWPGSVFIGLDGRFATWAGSVLRPMDPLLLVTPAGREREAVVRLARIGFDCVVGFLEGGIDALPVARRATAQRCAIERLSNPQGACLVDVRQPGEHAAGHPEGSLSIPVGQLEGRLAELPPDREVIFVCQTGYRSTLAASLARRAGREDIMDVAGGLVG